MKYQARNMKILRSLTCCICTALPFVLASDTSELVSNFKDNVEILSRLPFAQVVDGDTLFGTEYDSGLSAQESPGVPIVVAHGMGDSCFNPGMKSITEAISQRVGSVYSVCYGDGDSQPTDTINGFLMNMDKEVAFFAEKVKNDPKLANGFHAIGFSQGNLVIRGYIEKYNKPPVKSFISMHGPMLGVASIPHCDPENGAIHKLCQEMVQLLSTAAYSDIVQGLLAQANYLRDPERISEYLTTPFLPGLNNEVRPNETYKSNFESLEQLVLVKAKADTMIYPKESEWFGMFEDGGYETLLNMKDTKFYKDDLFGLRTLNEKGKVFLEATEGDHLRFSTKELFHIIDTYWQSTSFNQKVDSQTEIV